MTIQLFTNEGHATTAGNTLIKPPIVIHQLPNGTTIGARSTIGPACRPAGVTAGRAAGRPAGVRTTGAAGRTFSRRAAGRTGRSAGVRTTGAAGRTGRSAGVRTTGAVDPATPYPDRRSFGFGDEVIEEKAVLLLFEVKVVELNEE